MSWETAEERADRLFKPALVPHEGDPLTRYVAMPREYSGGSEPERVDLHHKPGGGEVPGIRATTDRFVRHLVEHGTDPQRARAIADREALKMERRLEAGPRR